MRRTLFAALLAASQVALATTMVRQDVPDLSRSSDAVLRGTVVRLESRWSGDRRVIFTEVEIEVAEAIKGEAPRTAIVRQRGGVVGNVGQRVDGLATFRKGEEVVVFLDQKSDGSFIVEGMAQGKFRVERTSDGRQAFAVPERTDAMVVDPATGQPADVAVRTRTLDELRNEVRAALWDGAPAAPVQKAPLPVEAK